MQALPGLLEGLLHLTLRGGVHTSESALAALSNLSMDNVFALSLIRASQLVSYLVLVLRTGSKKAKVHLRTYSLYFSVCLSLSLHFHVFHCLRTFLFSFMVILSFCSQHRYMSGRCPCTLLSFFDCICTFCRPVKQRCICGSGLCTSEILLSCRHVMPCIVAVADI